MDMSSNPAIDMLAVNTLRCLSIDMVQEANSGHPGLPLGCAPMAWVLWDRFLSHNPLDPKRMNRDRFILSAGHGSALLYALLHLTGYDMKLDDLKQFRQWESKTPGHPENFMTSGVEITTGPLGQGLSSAVGFAIAESHLAASYNKKDYAIVDHYTYVLCSDGDHMEGISGEAASLAGHLGLGKLIALYDSNNISIDGSTDIAFTEDVGKRYEAYGWDVRYVADGDTDLDAIEKEIRAAQGVTDKPSMIIVTTTIGFGSPMKAGTSGAHGSPLGNDELIATKKKLDRPTPEQRFAVPQEVRDYCVYKKDQAIKEQYDWERVYASYAQAYPNEAKELLDRMNGTVSVDFQELLKSSMGGEAATRKLSGGNLCALAENIPAMMGGSADLTPSNNTYLTCSHDYQKETPDGRNIRFGVREHGMGAIANGLALHGGFIPFVATFLIFTDYMKAAMRLAALSELQVLYIMTHDSIGLGEDGPTHQPVEILAGLRAIPNMYVMRPADATETAAAYALALSLKKSPTTFALTRQGLPNLAGTHFDKAMKGGYIVSDDADAEIILIATGSELHLATGAADELIKNGKKVRVVSMMCMRAFENQSAEYKKSILPSTITKRVVIEAGSSFGWGKYAGLEGKYICVDTFGASAPGGEIMKKFGFSVENVVEVVKSL